MESEFLTESTQKLRKSLLISSLIGFAISYAGLRVSEVSLLGSKLSITKFEVIPLVLCIIVLYFLVTFTIFGLYDYSQGYRKLRYDALERISKGTVSSRQEAEKALKELRKESKPMIIAANKVDLESGKENYEKLKKKYYDPRAWNAETNKLGMHVEFVEDKIK